MLAAPAESTAAPEQFRHGLPVFPVRVRIMSPLFLSGHLPKLRITAKKKQPIEYQTLSIHASSSAHFKSAVNQIF
ncbi:hypothetical protein [Akkermansia muciniphila]|jgi:hypothetical protein|uniref:hypothetical protein n=1 Tax=Akkermansia muciniphila TaxID=239935 RepID=UPI001034A11D|nr:hypothetical protein [Akkermansia muciniphila]MBS6356528.1 hypothetical protein [Akkermansia muciniphila]MCL6680873.1 hypothetical protein [Akkermansia muciniphila]QBH16835.1 hypothetical protein EYB66_05925 [Akkermansia muciniphila]QIA36287.1 hypothetical protein GXM23_07685 [Akkermansia muciniphila]UBU78578.1 hypothetical protein LDO78_09770 [Akkermansia muciniphila]